MSKLYVGLSETSFCCFVDRGLERCDYMDLRKGHEDSPCAKAAPLLFDMLEATPLCDKQHSMTQCKSQTQCEWYVTSASIIQSSRGIWCRISEGFFCAMKFFLIFFDIANFQDKVAQVIDRSIAAEDKQMCVCDEDRRVSTSYF